MKLSDLSDKIAEMASAVNASVDAYAEERLRNMCNLYGETLEPKVVSYVPYPGADPVDMPRTSLMADKRLIPDKLKLRFEGEVDLDEEMGISFRKSGTSRIGSVMIEMDFKATPTSEALELVRDKSNAVLSTELSRVAPTTNTEESPDG